MDDTAHEWCNPTRELTQNNLARLVRRSHRTSRVEPLRPPPEEPMPTVAVRGPVYPTYRHSPVLLRLALLSLVIAIGFTVAYFTA
jgi:hypothetical protein